MEKNLKKILGEIKINDLCPAQNLLESGAVLKISFKDKTGSILLDAGILEIGRQEISEIENRIRKHVESTQIKLDKLNILFTSESSLKNTPSAKPIETKKESASTLPHIKKIIVIASGKGGVGKSTLAANIAISLKKVGFKIGLADADIYGPSIAHMMNLQGKPASEGNLIIPLESYGIFCMSMGSMVETSHALAWRGPMVTKALNQLIKGVKWPNLDYLIIDLPPGTGDVHLSIAQLFPITGAVIISTPGEVAILDAVKAIDMFKKVNIPILGIVENMAYLQDESGKKSYIFGQDGAKNMAKKLNIDFLGEIELDAKIRKSGDEKNPITNSEPSGEISFDYGRIAENIIDKIEKLNK